MPIASGKAVMSHTAETLSPAGPAARTTGRRTAVLLVLVLTCVMAVRLPSLYAALERDFPAELAAELSDPQLRTLALRVGVAVGLLVSVLAAAVFVLLARQLERTVFPRTVRAGGLEVGLHTTVYVLSVVVNQAVPALWPAAAAAAPLLVPLACAVAATGRGALALSGPLRRAAPRPRSVAVASAFLLAVLAGWNWLP